MESNTSSIDLSRGFPDPKIFPSNEIKEILKEIDYNIINTEEKIKGIDDAIYYLLKIRGINFDFNLATSAMEVINDVILGAKSVGCEEPTHDGIIKKSKVIPHEGLVAEGNWQLTEDYFYFSIVNNPTGVVAENNLLKKFLEEAKNKGVKIILDDVYGYFSDVKAFFNENVIYVSSLSRILGPGIRIAFTNIKTKSKPSTISQYLVKRLYEMGVLQRVIDSERYVYSLRLKKISEFFEKYLYRKPKGGVSVLLTLPKDRFKAKVTDGSRYFRKKVDFTRITISRYDVSEIVQAVKL
ncbi:aminotransferase class I/II-fold pyridoxal phosphate-dependent enzyme [Acidianus sulfidivorans JP7]|uniref:Aminotransferase class I/classII large domain-containing protein n=1 Tax=Acidianus sulfidivorans JP7 TaxID=619593 RepID=A0A2U9ILL7_9CREN|nr:aminotransferase class I/II-fold pyridoxal phosphate-dependent enzyme [Acidianus sulfidivorans]AWR96949.1 aminotransferase class I/II-fold pyridoxal phosphate-dependent enzyme [Acidianus sulfidivorans JP7]